MSRERRSVLCRGVDIDVAAMSGDDGFRDVETEPDAASVAARVASLRPSHERLEDLLAPFRWNRRTLVVYRDGNFLRAGASAEGDRGVRHPVVRGVPQEIRDRLTDSLIVPAPV